MPFTQDTAQKILAKILKNTDFTHPTAWHVSLHTADPGNTGASECTGGSYARQSATFGTISGKAVSNSGALEFTGMPACTVTHVGIWSLASGGAFWWGGAATASKTLTAGDTYRIPVGDLTATLDPA